MSLIGQGLDQHIAQDPKWKQRQSERFGQAIEIAERIPLIHTARHSVLLESKQIPTSENKNYCSEATRRAEKVLELPFCVYMYAGRSHKSFGNMTFAFDSMNESLGDNTCCVDDCDGCVTPFDTGGLVHGFIDVNLKKDDVVLSQTFPSSMPLDDVVSGLVQSTANQLGKQLDALLSQKVKDNFFIVDRESINVYSVLKDEEFSADEVNTFVVASVNKERLKEIFDRCRVLLGQMGLGEFEQVPKWRLELAKFVSAYFESFEEFLFGVPEKGRSDPYEILIRNLDSRAWSFEIRVTQEIDYFECNRWAGLNEVVHSLKKRRADAKGPLDSLSDDEFDEFLDKRITPKRTRPTRASRIMNGWVKDEYLNG